MYLNTNFHDYMYYTNKHDFIKDVKVFVCLKWEVSYCDCFDC